jgi:hypothetical protein
MSLVCSTCGRGYTYDARRGHTRKRCNSCCANVDQARFKQRVLDHLGGRCVRCGYSRCAGALHVHHRDPSLKTFQVSGSHSRSWEKVLVELGGCELLCANCHAEEHFNERRYVALRARPRLPDRKVQWPKRPRLAELVQSLPLTQVGKMLNVSDNAVRKHCRKVGVEYPKRGRGFWAPN